jgi:hypothetical protein
MVNLEIINGRRFEEVERTQEEVDMELTWGLREKTYREREKELEPDVQHGTGWLENILNTEEMIEMLKFDVQTTNVVKLVGKHNPLKPFPETVGIDGRVRTQTLLGESNFIHAYLSTKKKDEKEAVLNMWLEQVWKAYPDEDTRFRIMTPPGLPELENKTVAEFIRAVNSRRVEVEA